MTFWRPLYTCVNVLPVALTGKAERAARCTVSSYPQAGSTATRYDVDVDDDDDNNDDDDDTRQNIQRATRNTNRQIPLKNEGVKDILQSRLFYIKQVGFSHSFVNFSIFSPFFEY